MHLLCLCVVHRYVQIFFTLVNGVLIIDRKPEGLFMCIEVQEVQELNYLQFAPPQMHWNLRTRILTPLDIGLDVRVHFGIIFSIISYKNLVFPKP